MNLKLKVISIEFHYYKYANLSKNKKLERIPGFASSLKKSWNGFLDPQLVLKRNWSGPAADPGNHQNPYKTCSSLAFLVILVPSEDCLRARNPGPGRSGRVANLS